MTPRNRARLRQFDDPENLRRLIELPRDDHSRAASTRSAELSEAIQVQSALAIAILTIAPMRIKNLASLRLGRHIVQTRPGGVRHIVIPAEEVKNGRRSPSRSPKRGRRGHGHLSRALSAAAGGRSGGFPVPGA